MPDDSNALSSLRANLGVDNNQAKINGLHLENRLKMEDIGAVKGSEFANKWG